MRAPGSPRSSGSSRRTSTRDGTAGDLLAVRNGRDYLYPAWQFGPDGEVLPSVGPVVSAAAGAGLNGQELYELLQTRDGLTSGRRLVDDVIDGRHERAVALIRAAAPGE